MFDLVDAENYYPVYINFCLLLIGLSYLHAVALPVNSTKNLYFVNFSGLILFLFITLFIGFRPINPIYFGDTGNYYTAYMAYAQGAPIRDNYDLVWHLFMKVCSKLISVHVFFTLCSFLYVYPLYKISKTYFSQYWFYVFVMFIVSFSFWPYGVNGVRNGVACSIFLWGLCYRNNLVVMSLLFILAISFHKTLMLPVFAFILTYFYNNPRSYFYGWLLAIPLSLALGSVWISLFASLGFGDQRTAAYLTTQTLDGTSSQIGFRWDFLFHSAFAVFAGWYFVIKRKFNDNFYNQLLNTYLICNAFWILVIRANYSNRFAYLSWFMMAIVIIYPILKGNFFKRQGLVLSNILAAYFAFTYLMFYLYYN
ncbi:EpsG family protein [Robiginitalea sp. IMCC43444]|uniref:EpsG family protein n=1 Tax=Robiginitalea sp. IMCC43444 TaxID=3459121 RepID=UPI0040428B9D